MLMTIADRMLLIDKNFANERFLKYLNTLQVANNTHELCHVLHVEKSVLLMRSCL